MPAWDYVRQPDGSVRKVLRTGSRTSSRNRSSSRNNSSSTSSTSTHSTTGSSTGTNSHLRGRPNVEGPPAPGSIAMIAPSGNVHFVQPSQVPGLTARGFRLATPQEDAATRPQATSNPNRHATIDRPGIDDPDIDDDDDDDDADDDSGAAKAHIKNMLNLYGLDELAGMVDGWVRKGLEWPEVEVLLRDPDSAAGKVVDRLYPELRKRAENGLPPMTIQQIREYKMNAKAYAALVGVPERYAENEFLTRLISGDEGRNVSYEEWKARADEYVAAGLENLASDPGLRRELEAFERYYGVKVKPGEIAGMMFDTDITLPAIQKRVAAVRLDVAAGRASYGDLSRSEAERLADVGVDERQAVEGFTVLSESRELFTPLDRSETAISREEGLSAVFEGNAAARKRIEDRARKRRAVFEQGGGFASGNSGFEGVGSTL